MKKYLVAGLTMTVACIGFVQAQIISVPNGSFEDAPSGAYTVTGSYDYVRGAGAAPYTTGVNTTLATGWTVSSIPTGGSYGLVNKNIFSPSEATAGDGQAFFIQDYSNTAIGGIVTSDSLGTILANTTYTLSLDIGAPPNLTGLSSYAAGEVAPQVTFALLGNGTTIASNTLVNTSVTEDGLTNYTLSFTTGASGGFIGDSLTVQLSALKELYPGSVDPGGEAAIFDDVVVTVPEPSTYALMLGGLSVLVFLTRWNRLKA